MKSGFTGMHKTCQRRNLRRAVCELLLCWRKGGERNFDFGEPQAASAFSAIRAVRRVAHVLPVQYRRKEGGVEGELCEVEQTSADRD
jgi:hypothetical protein